MQRVTNATEPWTGLFGVPGAGAGSVGGHGGAGGGDEGGSAGGSGGQLWWRWCELHAWCSSSMRSH